MCTVVLIYIFIFRAIIGKSWAIVKLPGEGGMGQFEISQTL